MSEINPLEIKDILSIIPHRYPFVMVDRVVELRPDEYIKAFKNVTFNEPFFNGHFPGSPVMPGVLLLEALGQTAILLLNKSRYQEQFQNFVFMFTGIERAKFRKPVRPGDRVYLECFNLQHKLNLWKMDARAFVEDKVVAEARFSASPLPASSL